MTPANFMRLSLGLGLAVAALCGPAHAAPAGERDFRLPQEPLDRALVRFAVQAGVSLGGAPPAACGARSRPVAGRMAPSEALARLLPENGCAFQAVDARTFRILPPSAGDAPASPPRRIGSPTIRTVALEELVVTSEKRADLLTHTPYAVSVLTGDDLNRMGAKSFADVALQVAGVTLTNLGSGRNKIFIRGLSDGSFTGRTQSTVGLYLNDVPITYNAPDPDLRLVDVERVEVLRGPQGTLYGSGSIGGIVRILTNKPETGRYAASVQVDGALTGRSGSSGLQAMLNAPMGERLALRAVAYSDERGGYIDNATLDLSNVNYSRRTGGRLALLADLPGFWRAEAGLVGQLIRTADSQYVQDQVGPFARRTPMREPHRNTFGQANMTFSRTGPATDLRVSAAFVDHKVANRYDATGSFPVPGPPGRRVAFDDRERAKLLVGEATLSAAAPGRLRWLVGFFASRAHEMDEAELRAPQEAGRIFSVSDRRDLLTEFAAYGEATYDFTSRLTLTGGGRAFATRLSSSSSVFNPATGPAGRFRGRLSEGGFSPKLRVSYRLGELAVAYAQAQQGYRPGGFNNPAVRALGRPDPAVLQTVPSFAPDRLWSYETGINTWPFGSTLRLHVAAYHADWRRLQSDLYLASGLPLTVNIGDGSNGGVEAEAVWTPDAHWQVRGNLMLNRPELDRVAFPMRAVPDVGLPASPKVVASAMLTYAWMPASGLTASVTGQTSYLGRSFLTFQGGAAVEMGGYGIARLGAELRSGRWRVEGYVENLTDARGDTFAFGNPFNLARSSQSTPLRPRTYGLAIGLSF